MIKRENLRSEYAKYIVVLMSGMVMAQVVSYLFSPIVTRLYTPEEMGELGLFLRIVGVGAALATLRYEPSLPILKTDSHSFRIYLFALRTAVITTLISCAAIFVPIIWSGDLTTIWFYVLLPIALLGTAMYNIGTNWSVRIKNYRAISYSKITNSLFSGGFKVLFGWMQMGYLGLIISSVVGVVLANVWFLRDYFGARRKFKIRSNSPRNYVLAKEYKEFPTVTLPHTLMDLSRELLMAVLILELFSKEDLGLFEHSSRMLRIPLVFAGLAIGQVFYQRCAEKVNNGEDIVPLITRTVRTLFLLSILPFAALFFFGEDLFAFVFGEDWRSSGFYAEVLVLMTLLSFITSPIASIPMIVRKQKEFFKLALLGSINMILAIVVPRLVFEADMITTLWTLNIAHSIYLVFLMTRIFKFARDAKAENRKE